nr:3-deoxy-manno-octulosonate cytidylyltransferase [Armatimonas sp.]
MKTVALIPARLAATRLPDKPLALIAGKTMIQHVWERARSAARIDEVFIATPDQAIADAVRAFGGSVLMTHHDHQTGTDRLAEAARQLSPEVTVIVNVQGDEPLIEPATIDAAAEPLLADTALVMSSLCCPLPEGRESDPNVVKVVLTQENFALYFSRSPLPYRRNADAPGYQPLQHIGLYAYRRDFLEIFPTLSRTPLEQIESLEQLRVLEHGYHIKMVFTDRIPESVDTPEDLERVRSLFSS